MAKKRTIDPVNPVVYLTIGEFKKILHDEVTKIVREHVKPIPPFEVMTTSEAAKLLRTQAQTLRLWADRGLIESFNIGNRRMFTMVAIQEFVNRKGSSDKTNPYRVYRRVSKQ
jgi:excisionase family DNA binding protein